VTRETEEDRRRWLVLAGCLVCQMGLGLGGYVIAAFLKPVVEELGWTRTAFSVSTLPFLLAMALASPLVGRVTDRLGGRAVFAAAITVVAATLVALAGMESVAQFYVLSFVLGAGVTGLGDIPAGGVVARWFPDRRGLALGLTYLGSNVGGAIVPVVAGIVTEAASWRTALIVLAAGGWLLIFPAAVALVRDGPVPTGGSDDADSAVDGLTLAEAVRTRAFWMLGVVLFLFYFYYVGVNHHLVAYLADAGASYRVAARGFGYAVLGKVGAGLLADRISVRPALLATFGLLTLGSWLLLALETQPGLQVVFLTLHGVTVAAENVMLPLVVAACFGARHLAAIYGALMLALLPGGALGPVLAGWVHDASGSYRVAFTVFALGNVVALGLLAGLRPARRKR
jgi:MFS family permease